MCLFTASTQLMPVGLSYFSPVLSAVSLIFWFFSLFLLFFRDFLFFNHFLPPLSRFSASSAWSFAISNFAQRQKVITPVGSSS